MSHANLTPGKAKMAAARIDLISQMESEMFQWQFTLFKKLPVSLQPCFLFLTAILSG